MLDPGLVNAAITAGSIPGFALASFAIGNVGVRKHRPTGRLWGRLAGVSQTAFATYFGTLGSTWFPVLLPAYDDPRRVVLPLADRRTSHRMSHTDGGVGSGGHLPPPGGVMPSAPRWPRRSPRQ